MISPAYLAELVKRAKARTTQASAAQLEPDQSTRSEQARAA
ncbi:MAG TPA: hypothetical protein VK875_13165 [Euzebyales bacterium]|nr:hypothetical protein [Euzebyales bacterium]